MQLKIPYFLTRENLMEIQAGNDKQMKELQYKLGISTIRY